MVYRLWVLVGSQVHSCYTYLPIYLSFSSYFLNLIKQEKHHHLYDVFIIFVFCFYTHSVGYTVLCTNRDQLVKSQMVFEFLIDCSEKKVYNIDYMRICLHIDYMRFAPNGFLNSITTLDNQKKQKKDSILTIQDNLKNWLLINVNDACLTRAGMLLYFHQR